MHRAATFALLAVSLLMPAPAARAQQPLPPPSSPASHAESGAELRVFLMTFSDGSIIYEKFGHNAICIHDPTPPPEHVAAREAFEGEIDGRLPPVAPFIGTDRAYHYGAFDFEQENFVWRFLHGKMSYWISAEWADLTALSYAGDDRSVLVQELDLPPAGKLELQRFLEQNLLPEHRMYKYDYYRDNCSTRVRDAIDGAAGGTLARQLQPLRTDATYRSHTRRVNSGLDPLNVFWFTAFSYVLGHPVDVKLSAWEECFLPEKLAERVRTAHIPDGRGGSRPLVSGETYFHVTTRPPQAQVEPRRTVGYGVAGLLVGSTFVGLASLRPRSRRGRVVRGIAFTLVFVPWAVLWGLGGTIGTYGWAVTDHAASYRNENLLQMTPLMLPLVVLAPAMAFGRRRGARLAVRLAVAGAVLSALGMILQVLPWLWQQNGEIVALALPANVGLALALVRLRSRAELSDATPGAVGVSSSSTSAGAAGGGPGGGTRSKQRGRKRVAQR